jgi:hypothetical protein
MTLGPFPVSVLLVGSLRLLGARRKRRATLQEEAMKAYAITMERHRLEAALEDARREVGVSERI